MYYTRKVKRPSAETNNFYLKLAVWLLAGLILLAVNATFFGPSGLATRPDSNVSFTIDSLNLYSYHTIRQLADFGAQKAAQ